jgi:hypothetical protein
MTVKTFWNRATVLETTVRYVVIPAKGREWTVSRAEAAHIHHDPEFPRGWVVERRVTTTEVKACPWCGARPELFERDCDGYAGTGTCGSPQCKQLQRCDGCGQDGVRRWGTWRGDFCDPCYRVATERGLATIPGLYGLFRHEDYAPYYA